MADARQGEEFRIFGDRGCKEQEMCAMISYCHLGEVAEWSKAADC
jgi:hypothetical protein